MFGILDVSLAVFMQSTFSNATRAGARWAVTFSSTYNGSSCTSSQAACVAQVVQDNAAGFLGGSKSQYIAVRYYTTNDLGNPVMTCQNGACTTTGTLPQTLASGAVVSYANQPGNVVEVAVSSFPLTWMVPIPGYSAGTGLTLGAVSSDVLGGLPVGVFAPPNP